MAGHSKWAQIKRQKGATDKKRGQLFSKLAKLISVAARDGGGNPDMNPRLRLLIDQARGENMPKDSIERAVKRGTGELGGDAIEEMRFEAYAPGGVGILIDVTTDNPRRPPAEIKATLNKQNGKLAATGAVAYQFVERGILRIPIAATKQDDLELAIIEAGAENYERQGEELVVFTEPKSLTVVKASLEEQGITITEAKLAHEPTQPVTITDPSLARQIFRLMEALEDLDDVTAVTGNFDVADEVIQALGDVQ